MLHPTSFESALSLNIRRLDARGTEYSRICKLPINVSVPISLPLGRRHKQSSVYILGGNVVIHYTVAAVVLREVQQAVHESKVENPWKGTLNYLDSQRAFALRSCLGRIH